MNPPSDRPEFEAFYRSNSEDLFVYTYRSVRDEGVARDIVQDCFLNFFKIFRNRPWPQGDGARMYLFRIARNLMINRSREAYTRRVSTGMDGDRSGGMDSVGNAVRTTRSVEQEYEEKELEELLQQALAELKEEERTAIQLRYYHNMKLEEISRIMDVSIATASRLIKRAQASLRENAERYR